MKKPYIFLLTLIFATSTLFGQEVTVGNVKVRFKRGRPVSKNFHLHSATKMKSKGETEWEKIKIVCKMKSLDGSPVDVNAFSLIDTTNHFRYRMIEFLGYLPIGGHYSDMLIKEEIIRKNGKPYKLSAEYDPSKKDSFNDFMFEGYQNIEIPMDFSVPVEDSKRVVYFGDVPYNKFTASMYFMIVSSLKFPSLQLYYGKEKLADIKLDD